MKRWREGAPRARRAAHGGTGAPSRTRRNVFSEVSETIETLLNTSFYEVYPYFDRCVFGSALKAIEGSSELLSIWRSNRGKYGYAALNAMSVATKAAIRAVFAGRDDVALQVEASLRELLQRLRETFLGGEEARNIPEWTAHLVDEWFLRNRVIPGIEGELLELTLFRLLWPLVSGKKSGDTSSQIPSPREMGISLRSWMKGAADCIGELSKCVQFVRENPELSLEEHRGILQRYLAVARGLLETLKSVSAEAAAIFGRGVGSEIWRAENIIRRASDELAHANMLLAAR
jgi:hypothetical protein